ncbi:MAG: sel1 repeat family protein [Magnetococcales bacterium]|nr:sel1 repeat family protein [Magnetococcales bacterium]
MNRKWVLPRSLKLLVIGGLLSWGVSGCSKPSELPLMGVGEGWIAVNDMMRAANEGHAVAQSNLGARYAMGKGVPQDYQEALRWCRKAAEQGDAKAQYNLGVMYGSDSDIVPQDEIEAEKWYRLAADQGYAAAQFKMGTLYDYGNVVEQDDIQAHVWYNLAAAKGHREAIKARDDLSQSMNDEKLAQAHEMARNWKPVQRAVSSTTTVTTQP